MELVLRQRRRSKVILAAHMVALKALSASLTAADSPLAASLAGIVADAIQDLIETKLSARIGAEPNERRLARSSLRNGRRDKLVSTPAGDNHRRDPKTPEGIVLPGTP